MDLSLTALLGSGASVLGLVGALVAGSMRLARLELKVDTMWAFQMRRAMGEAVSSGIATVNSPLKFTDEAIGALEPIRGELLAFWATLPSGVSDADALLQIEARFGDALLHYVCLPCGLSHGACLLLALTIAKQSDEITLH